MSSRTRSLSYHDLLIRDPGKTQRDHFVELKTRYRSQSVAVLKIKPKASIIPQKKVQPPKLQLRVPFQVYKSTKPLTEFKEFKLWTSLRSQNKENINSNIPMQFRNKI